MIPVRLWQLLTTTERIALALLALGYIASSACEVIGLLFVYTFVAGIGSATSTLPFLDPFAGIPGSNEWAARVAASLLLVYTAKVLLALLTERRLLSLAGAVHRRAARRLFAHLLELSYERHVQRGTESMRRELITNTSTAFGEALPATVRVAGETIVIVAMAVVLLFHDGILLGALGLLLGGVAAIYLRGSGGVLREAVQARQNRLAELNRAVAQALSGVREVRILGREATFIARQQRALEDLQAAQQRLRLVESLPRQLNEIAVVLSVAAGGLILVYSRQTLAHVAPSLALFAVAGLRAAAAFARWLAAANVLRSADTATREVLHQLDSLSPRPAQPEQPEPILLERTMTFSRVTFAYGQRTDGAIPECAEQQPPAIQDVSLEISCGQVVALAGASGAGKSTLLHLAAGILIPQAGAILVDGQPIHRNVAGWQQQLAYIPQAPYFAPESLRRNVAFGVPDGEVDETWLVYCLERAQMWPMVTTLPNGLSTNMREEAAAFSGGERQRVAIARALYANRPVLLVDEATANLDHANEHGVMNALLSLGEKTTIILVAHRVSTLRRAHRIFLLAKGRLMAEGTFDALLVSHPEYFRVTESELAS